MYTLALDTSTKKTHIALLGKGVAVGVTLDLFDSHNELLADAVQSVLKSNGIKATDLDRVIFGNGPGSFTGLRIGASFTVGFIATLRTLGGRVQSFTMSSLEIFAVGYLLNRQLNSVFMYADARREEVFGIGLDMNHEHMFPLAIYPQVASEREDSCSVDTITKLDFLAGVTVAIKDSQRYLAEFADLGNLPLNYVRPVQARTIAERAQVQKLV